MTTPLSKLIEAVRGVLSAWDDELPGYPANKTRMELLRAALTAFESSRGQAVAPIAWGCPRCYFTSGYVKYNEATKIVVQSEHDEWNEDHGQPCRDAIRPLYAAPPATVPMEEAANAIRHVLARNHEYHPEACDGCAHADQILGRRG